MVSCNFPNKMLEQKSPGCTMLGLMDVVFASSSATFHVPFTALALTPEACSSRTFPRFQQIEQNQAATLLLLCYCLVLFRIMGSSVANQMLLFNRKLTAEEAAATGFVSEVGHRKFFGRPNILNKFENDPKVLPVDHQRFLFGRPTILNIFENDPRCCLRTICIQRLPLVSPNMPPCQVQRSNTARWQEFKSKSFVIGKKLPSRTC